MQRNSLNLCLQTVLAESCPLLWRNFKFHRLDLGQVLKMWIETVNCVHKFKVLGTISVVCILALTGFVASGQGPVSASGFSAITLNTDDAVNRKSVSLTSPERNGSASTDPVAIAEWFLGKHATELSIDPTQVQLDRVLPGASGLQTIRFTQTLSDIPVPGSLITFTLTKDLALVEYNTVTIDVRDRYNFLHHLSDSAATALTKNAIANKDNVSPSDVSVAQLLPVVVFSSLVPGITEGHYLAWQSWTASAGAGSTAVTYLDDASGNLLGTFPIARKITNSPNVCDLQQALASDYQGQNRLLGSTLVYKSGSKFYLDSTGEVYPICGKSYTGRNVASTQVAQDNIDATWSYFKNVLNLDINEEAWLGNISQSVDGDSKPRISAFTNICVKDQGACPKFQNAFWVPWNSTSCRSGACSAIFMGSDFDQALDVIAHELTHGVTFATSFSGSLYEKSEAGALSESLSDIFGEAAERLTPTSPADPNWDIGEMVNPDTQPFRSMKSPDVPAITSNWKSDDSHTNNGPGNRFAWLVANGGTFGSTVIEPIGGIPADGSCPTIVDCAGITRLSVLVYSALPKLTSSSSYFDFGKAIMNSCKTLLTAGEDGFSDNTCLNVARALRLTGISKIRVSNLTTVSAVSKSTRMAVKGNVTSLTGADVYKQPMQLEQLVKGKWVKVLAADAACKKYCTDVNNRVTFYVKWSKSATYRISTKTDFNAVIGFSPLARVRVR